LRTLFRFKFKRSGTTFEFKFSVPKLIHEFRRCVTHIRAFSNSDVDTEVFSHEGMLFCADASKLFLFPILATSPIVKNFAKHIRRHNGGSVLRGFGAFRHFFFRILNFRNTGATNTRTHTHIQTTSRLTITDANTDLQINVLITNNSVIYFVHCLNELKPFPATRNIGNISDWKSGTSIWLCNTTYMCYIATFSLLVSKYFMDSVSVSRHT
jgi:hypothetical protein